MKRPVRVLSYTLTVILVVLMLVTCSTSTPWKYEFGGTWSFPLGLGTWQFGDNSGSANVNLGFSYTLAFDYIAVDEAANHIQVNITSATGSPTATVGTAYITYSISGNDLYISILNSGYPPSAADGAFTRQ